MFDFILKGHKLITFSKLEKQTSLGLGNIEVSYLFLIYYLYSYFFLLQFLFSFVVQVVLAASIVGKSGKGEFFASIH